MKFDRGAVLRRLALGALVPLCAAAGLAGCKSFTDLNESAQTFISPDKFYQNDNQAAIAVNGVYAPLMGWNGWKSPAGYGVMCEDNEITCWNWMGGGWSGTYAGEWYMQGNSVYFGDYQIIQRANDVIANVAASTGITAPVKQVATGQALFARAYAYFDLVKRFGGVPLRLEPYKPEAQLGAMARSPVDVVYKQITADLRQAAGMLPTSYSTANGQGLPRAASAWGLLAKVYLHMTGDEATGTPLAANKSAYLDSAKLAAQKVTSDPSVRLEANYMDLFDTNKQNTSPEILFAVQGATVNLGGSQIPAYFAPRGDCTLIGGCGQGFASLRQDFYDTFDKANDKRVQPYKAIARKWEVTYSALGKIAAISEDSINVMWSNGSMIRDQQFRWESWTEACAAFGHHYDSLTYKVNGATKSEVIAVARPIYSMKYNDPAHLGSDQASANNFIILRYADVLLVLAEAENEKNGPTAVAYDAINQVRARAGLPALSGLTQAQFRDAVWTERSHELYGEFQGRFDLIREGRWLNAMNEVSKVSDFSSFGPCRPRKAYQKLQPLPQAELNANTLITQNPGW